MIYIHSSGQEVHEQFYILISDKATVYSVFYIPYFPATSVVYDLLGL